MISPITDRLKTSVTVDCGAVTRSTLADFVVYRSNLPGERSARWTGNTNYFSQITAVCLRSPYQV